jgi:hypothetical protein
MVHNVMLNLPVGQIFLDKRPVLAVNESGGVLHQARYEIVGQAFRPASADGRQDWLTHDGGRLAPPDVPGLITRSVMATWIGD